MASFGGTVKRYEIQPDPDLLKRYGITLTQLQNAISGCNANVGGDYVTLGPGRASGAQPGAARRRTRPGAKSAGHEGSGGGAKLSLREEEDRRVREIRDIGIASTNNVPVRVGDVVDGGRVPRGYPLGDRGVIVGHQTRLGRITPSIGR